MRGVDLAIRAGEFVVLLGPNGAGKSTLVKAIAGLAPVHSGSVLLNGDDITLTPTHRKSVAASPSYRRPRIFSRP